jgi:hypothetical protein
MQLVTVPFIAVAATFGGFILWWMFGIWWFEQSKILKLLPDSALERVALDSPEAKAFLARCPTADVHVMQDFSLPPPDCCEVTLDYIRNNTEVCLTDEYGYLCRYQGPGAMLYARLNVSSDLKTVSIGQTWLQCSDRAEKHPDYWTVKGNIVENLRLDNPDCWDVGAPPRPSDAELIEMAKNTTEAKAYLARYPDNKILFDKSNPYEDRITFTPAITEPIEFMVHFDKVDWVINRMTLVCSNGASFENSDEPDFLAFLQPEHGCIQSVHSKLEAANETIEVKEFLAKYPKTRGLTGGYPEPDPSIIQYTNTGIIEPGCTYCYPNEAMLTVMFEGDALANFELACYISDEDYPEKPKDIRSVKGKHIDVTSYLQGDLCP